MENKVILNNNELTGIMNRDEMNKLSLVIEEKKWNDYVSNQNVKTDVLKDVDNLAGYFELNFHPEKDEVEIAYLGLLEEYQNKKLVSYLLSKAIKNSFLYNYKDEFKYF